MKKLLKKLKKLTSMIACGAIFLSMSPVQSVYAKELNNDVTVGEYQSFNYNGRDEIYLGQFDFYNGNNRNSTNTTMLREYREYDRYLVYDKGITEKWNWLSNPYFIISVAKGATYEKSRNISATINASVSGDFPSDAKSSILSSFSIGASGSKTISEKVTFSGPSDNYSSRDFYYQKGTHRHSVKVVREHRSSWDGVLWTKTYYATVDVPGIRTYSEDH